MNKIIKQFLQDKENQDLINLGDFKTLYEKAMEKYQSSSFTQELMNLLQDADIVVDVEQVLPGFPNYINYPELNYMGTFPYILLNSEFTANVIYENEHKLKQSTLYELFHPTIKYNKDQDYFIQSDIKVQLYWNPGVGKVCLGCEYGRANGTTYSTPIY